MTIPAVVSRADAQVAARLFTGSAEPTRPALPTALRDGERTVPLLTPAVQAWRSSVSAHLACRPERRTVDMRPHPGG